MFLIVILVYFGDFRSPSSNVKPSFSNFKPNSVNLRSYFLISDLIQRFNFQKQTFMTETKSS